MGELRKESRAVFDALTPRERECLRLVAQHHRSKEIARLLNISKSTVDKHIDSARDRLGAPDRRTAALALAAHEMSMGILYPSDPDPIPARGHPPSTEALFASQAGPLSDEFDAGSTTALQPGVPGQLDSAGVGAEPVGQPRQGGSDRDGGFGPAQDAVVGSAGKAAGPDPQRHGVADFGRYLLGRGGADELTSFRVLTRIAGMAIVGSLLLGGVLMGAHEVALLVQRIIDGIWPRGG